MRIKQVLNNNVVSAVDASGVELILTGRGLGFNTTAGDEVPENSIEKIFRLDDDKIYSRFKILLNEIPVEIVQLTDDIVQLATSSLSYQLGEGL
ncbi:CAT RNA binding domain-containing protein [Erwinia sp. V71]|uniref:CAT RNA binding domain-containing protein n=1 Tax=Erwinia sp. V71 TaxID=3369424 RepID=UPI003F5FA3AD